MMNGMTVGEDEHMKWKEKLSQLPIIMPNELPSKAQCLEGDVYGAHFVATNTYLLGVGPVFVISFSGNEQKIADLMKKITIELGSVPMHFDGGNSPEFFAWPSGCHELPDPVTYQRLGAKTIQKILREYKVLDLERLMKEVLIAYDFLVGDDEARFRYMSTILPKMQRSRFTTFSLALMDICKQFAKVNIQSAKRANQAMRN